MYWSTLNLPKLKQNGETSNKQNKIILTKRTFLYEQRGKAV